MGDGTPRESDGSAKILVEKPFFAVSRECLPRAILRAESHLQTIRRVLLTHQLGPVLTLTLNRPEKRNALNAGLVAMLTDALDGAARKESIRAIILTGEGPVFSAGADLESLQALQTATEEENLADSGRLAELFEVISRHPKPVIAKVNGHAIAGGCGLAAVCDFSIAVEGAKLGFTETRIGFVPAIVAVFVLRKLGEAAARDLLLRGHLITASEAARIGLVTRTVPADELDAAADELADELSRETSGSAVALTKELLAELPGMSLRDALDYAARLNARARATDDCKAGIAAFLNKTEPPWKGKREK